MESPSALLDPRDAPVLGLDFQRSIVERFPEARPARARGRAGGRHTLVLAGTATGGVVLSTLRAAADKDHALVVAGDGCADGDAEVHDVLLRKVFPGQATVATSEAVAAALRGPGRT